ncbi:MAG: hypothetical protein WCC11_04850 [Gammaproteobacteria bacterium]
MNSMHKLIFTVAVIVNVAAIATVMASLRSQRSTTETQTINLGAIVVTPADAQPGPIQLGTVVVTPSDADWRYAATRGVRRPVVTAAIEAAPLPGDDAGATLVEALEAFSPGQFLDADAELSLLNTLVFESNGR